MDNIEYIDKGETKVRTVFMGTCFTILTMLLSLSYGLTWGVLFLIYTSKKDYPTVCITILGWDRALYIVQFISAGLHLVSSIFQVIATSYDKESYVPKYIMGCRSCLLFLAGITILLGINISYFNNQEMDKCGDLKLLNLAYIITEWTLLGSCSCFVCVVCTITIIFKKRKKKKRGF